MSHNSRFTRFASAQDNIGTLGGMSLQVGTVKQLTDEERHSAALTVAERALSAHWSLDTLSDVLDALGLKGDE